LTDAAMIKFLDVGDIVNVQLPKGANCELSVLSFSGPIVFIFKAYVRPTLEDVLKYYAIAPDSPRLYGLSFTPLSDRLVVEDIVTGQYHIIQRTLRYIEIQNAEIQILRQKVRRRSHARPATV